MEARRRAALFLFCFSSISAELVTGSSPPLQFAILSWLLLPFYGLGVLTVYEFTVHWRKGWPTVMLLGLAYGIVEEGLTNLTFFNPNWPGVVTYGREFGGVNWVWSVSLADFHGVVSISIPILVTQLLFPQFKWQPLVRSRFRALLPVAFVLVAFFQYFFILANTHFTAEPVPWLGALGVTLGLVVAARRAPYHLFHPPSDQPLKRPRWFLLLGVFFGTGSFLLEAFLGAAGTPFPAIMAVLVGQAILVAYLLEKNLGVQGNDLHKLAVVFGIQAMFITWEIGFELTNPYARGITVTGAMYFGFLGYWLRKRVLQRMAPLGAPMVGAQPAMVEGPPGPPPLP